MPVSPPRPKGPPLNALRAFEAAGRLESFATAAEELNVTPGAIAQQIKALEGWVGARLFDRLPQGIKLTEAGHKILPAYSDAFDALAAANRALLAHAAPQRVSIAALPSLAQLWLSPRLPNIRAALPDAEISVTALEAPPNPKRDTFDLALFFEDDADDDAVGRDRILPVCAPSVARSIHSIDGLKAQTCLSDSTWDGDWQCWLAAAGRADWAVPKGPVYSLYALALEETCNGAGVLIGHEALIQRELTKGALVAPFDIVAETGRVITLRHIGPGPENPVAKKVKRLLSGSAPT